MTAGTHQRLAWTQVVVKHLRPYTAKDEKKITGTHRVLFILVCNTIRHTGG